MIALLGSYLLSTPYFSGTFISFFLKEKNYKVSAQSRYRIWLILFLIIKGQGDTVRSTIYKCRSLNWIRVPHSLCSTLYTVQVLVAHMSNSMSLISKQRLGPVSVQVLVAVQVLEVVQVLVAVRS